MANFRSKSTIEAPRRTGPKIIPKTGFSYCIPGLTTSINEYIAQHNDELKPLINSAKAQDILQKVVRANANLSSKQNKALHLRLQSAKLYSSDSLGQR